MTVFFLGHSLIEFFDWQKRFPSHRVFNLGRAGETVEGLLSRLGGIIKNYPTPDSIFIMTGINNIAMEDFEFFGPLREIIGTLKGAYPECRIFLNGLLPVRFEWIADESIRMVNGRLEDLARETGVGYLSAYNDFVSAGLDEMLLPDGVHLTEKGYAVWSAVIEKELDVL